MIEVKHTADIQEGKYYTLTTHRTNPTTETKRPVICISKDYTPLNRDIVYICFADTWGIVPTKQQFIDILCSDERQQESKKFKRVMALWGWELKDGALTYEP